MVKDCRAVLRADVRSLPVERRWIVDRKENLQQLLVGNHLRVEGDLDRLRVTGCTGADLLVGRVFYVAARVPRNDFRHPAQLVEDRLQTPETAARQRRQLSSRLWLRRHDPSSGSSRSPIAG